MLPDTTPHIKTLDSFETEKYSIFWLEGNLFKTVVRENMFMNEAEFKEMHHHKARLVKNRPHGVLFYTPQLGNLSKEARDYLATPEANVNAVAKAIIASNLGMRILANFFVEINKPVIPHKAFLNETDALIWLQDALKKAGVSPSV